MTVEEELDQLKLDYGLLQDQLTSQQILNTTLVERIQALEARLAQDSHNSSKPPSSDGSGNSFARPPKKRSLRKVSGKPVGGQSGHQGQALRQVENPDQVLTYLPTQCHHCSADLTQVSPDESYQPRQVLELPRPYRLEVIEHRAYSRKCLECERLTAATFPPGVNNWVQYGPGVKALATYLITYQLLPYSRASELLNELYTTQISPGTLALWVEQGYDQLASTEASIKTALKAASVLHCDETGLYVQGKRQWLHVASTTKLTYYATHLKRGKAATTEMDLLGDFKGVAVHDGWASYQSYHAYHALCNAHHLRELTFLAEQYAQDWAKEFKHLLLTLKEEVDQAKACGQTALSSVRLVEYEQRYQTLLAVGLAANAPPVMAAVEPTKPKSGRVKQSKAKNLLDRLAKHRRQVLLFAYRFEVPFDNNQAERDIRMVKVQQKVSGCFRTKLGAAYFCRIRGYLSTMRKQGENLLVALFATFVGKPVLPPSLT